MLYNLFLDDKRFEFLNTFSKKVTLDGVQFYNIPLWYERVSDNIFKVHHEGYLPENLKAYLKNSTEYIEFDEQKSEQ